MNPNQSSRRRFLQTTAAAAAAPYFFTGAKGLADDAKAASPNDRPVLGCIGTGSRWQAVGPNAMKFADCVAVCDADQNHAAQGKERAQGIQAKKGRERKIEVYEDYRKILDRKDIDVVTIVTPDHWHTKIAIEAMHAGKDVYCEKPLTLTIDEGKQIIKALKETGRVFQVGTQQRSEMGGRFLTAVAMVREGRIGKVKRVVCNIGGAPTSGPIPITEVPAGLNWDLWQGQTPVVDFRFAPDGRWGKSRCHYEFRWWYEYSGGKMTDWGAHHVDIATWALEMGASGPVSVEGVFAKHPVPYKDGHATLDDQYNVATEFDVKVMYPNGVEMHILSNSPDGNGILFEGTKGRFHVSRSRMKGKPAEELAANPISPEVITRLYKGKQPGDHMRNLFECIKTREQPISDVYTHHRAMTTCHLANIAIRLGRGLKWDASSEQIVGDAAANTWLKREQRKGYEIEA